MSGEIAGILHEALEVLREIAHNTRLKTENIHELYELDTSLTDVQTLHVSKDLGTPALSVSILDIGGGLSLAPSDETLFEVIDGDQLFNEDFNILRWQGSGVAGTAILRAGGVVGDRKARKGALPWF